MPKSNTTTSSPKQIEQQTQKEKHEWKRRKKEERDRIFDELEKDQLDEISNLRCRNYYRK